MGKASKATKWAYTYGSLQVEVYDSLEEAIGATIDASDAGTESLDFIEYEGERVTASHPLYRAIEESNDEAEARRREQKPPITHIIEVQHPDGQWVRHYGLTTEEPTSRYARDEHADLLAALGPERVRIVPVNRRRIA